MSDRGERGERGASGERGERGASGERGLTGPQGFEGTQGIAGPSGAPNIPQPQRSSVERSLLHSTRVVLAWAVVLLVANAGLSVYTLNRESDASTERAYITKLDQCLIEQTEEHRVSNLAGHEQIAASQSPPVSINSATNFGGQFKAPDPLTLQRIKDKLGAACAIIDKGLLNQP